jgi:hypothetical protein
MAVVNVASVVWVSWPAVPVTDFGSRDRILERSMTAAVGQSCRLQDAHRQGPLDSLCQATEPYHHRVVARRRLLLRSSIIATGNGSDRDISRRYVKDYLG